MPSALSDRFAALAEHCVDAGRGATFTLPIGSANVRLRVTGKKSTKFSGKDPLLEDLLLSALEGLEAANPEDEPAEIESTDGDGASAAELLSEALERCVSREIGLRLDCQWYRDEPRYALSLRLRGPDPSGETAALASIANVLEQHFGDIEALSSSEGVRTFGVFRDRSSSLSEVCEGALEALGRSDEELIAGGVDLDAPKPVDIEKEDTWAHASERTRDEDDESLGVLSGSAKVFTVYTCHPTAHDDYYPVYSCPDTSVHLAPGQCPTCGEELQITEVSDINEYLSTYELMA